MNLFKRAAKIEPSLQSPSDRLMRKVIADSMVKTMQAEGLDAKAEVKIKHARSCPMHNGGRPCKCEPRISVVAEILITNEMVKAARELAAKEGG